MPHTQSAKKRLKQSEKRRQANKSVKTHLKTRVKKFNTALAAGNVEEARKEALLLQKSLDRAVTHGVIHENQADRKKSRSARKLSRLVSTRAGT